MKVIDDCIFPNKITMKKILNWYEKLKKEGFFYEFKHTNKPMARKEQIRGGKKQKVR